jgi:hypothetical protein
MVVDEVDVGRRLVDSLQSMASPEHSRTSMT